MKFSGGHGSNNMEIGALYKGKKGKGKEFKGKGKDKGKSSWNSGGKYGGKSSLTRAKAKLEAKMARQHPRLQRPQHSKASAATVANGP